MDASVEPYRNLNFYEHRMATIVTKSPTEERLFMEATAQNRLMRGVKSVISRIRHPERSATSFEPISHAVTAADFSMAGIRLEEIGSRSRNPDSDIATAMAGQVLDVCQSDITHGPWV